MEEMSPDERDALAKNLFLTISTGRISDLEERRLVMAYIEDEMFEWIKRLQLWAESELRDHKVVFRSRAYRERLNVMWFTLTGLLRDPRNPCEWARERIGHYDMTCILALVREFDSAFDSFELMDLPNTH